MTDQSGASKAAANRDNAEEMVEKYHRNILRRLQEDGEGYYDASDFRGWCGVSEKDRLRGDFVLRAIRILVREGELISQKGGLFKRVASESEDASDEGVEESVPASIDQEASATVDELVETEIPKAAIEEAEPAEDSAPLSDDDDAAVDASDDAEATGTTEQVVPTKRRHSPRGGFRAWLVEYAKPDVIFQTKELLRLALEAGVCATRAAGQLQLNRLVTEGVLTRKRRGYVTLTVAAPKEVPTAIEEASSPPVAETPPETCTEPVALVSVPDENADRAREDAPAPAKPKKPTKSKRRAKKAATKSKKASKPDLLAQLPKIFGEERKALLALLKMSGRERKAIVGAIHHLETSLSALDAATARARAMIEAFDRGIATLVALERSLRPSKR